MDGGQFATILDGDIAKKTDTGGMFPVEDAKEAAERFADQKIVYTGPIFGYKMRSAEGTAALGEACVLDRFGLSLQAFKPLRASGSRRPAVIYPENLMIESAPEGLCLRFTLPKGAYATTLLREFMAAER
jgi:tRNA pseudouridine13 synthase